jgi:hypothetical protein
MLVLIHNYFTFSPLHLVFIRVLYKLNTVPFLFGCMFQLSTGVMNPTEDGFSWALQRIQNEEPASSQGMQLEACVGTQRAQPLFQPGEGSVDQD